MLDVMTLPHLNAGLNGMAAILLAFGFYQIKSGNKERHKAVMLSAVVVSAVFLASYLTYHYHSPIYLFNGVGPIKTFYYALLISHVVLAALNVPMIIWALWRALSGNFDKHKRIARWTAPIWFYVSISGIGVYLMLYQFNPPVAS